MFRLASGRTDCCWLGQVTGAGLGLGVSNLDVEVTEHDAGLALIRRVLRDSRLLRAR